MSKADKFEINGVDVTAYVRKASMPVNDTIRKEDQGTAELRTDIFDLITTLNINDTFVYYRGEVTANVQKWDGYISKVLNQTGTIEIEIKGDLTRIDRREINKTYDIDIDPEAGVLSAIAEDIITDGGLTANVDNSGTLNVFTVFPCRREPRSRKLRELEDTNRWNCYYDHTNSEVLYKARAGTSTGVTLTVGSYPVINAPIWEEDDSVLYNQFTVEGLEIRVGRTDWFDGDASTTEFTLTEYPVGINNVWSGTANFQTTRPTSSDLVTGGAEDVTANADYYWREESKTLKFVSGSTPASGTNNIQVDYNYNEALPGFFLDEESQGTYGVREKTVTVLYLNNESDVENIGLSLIEEFKDSKRSTMLLVGNDLTEFPGSANLQVNKTVNIIDEISPKNVVATLPIRKITLKYPEPYDELEVGEHLVGVDDFLERTIDRIKKIEDRFKTQGGLRQYRTFNATTEFPAQLDVYLASPDTGVLYWDDDNQGDWGNDAGTTGYNWGNDTAETETLARRVHHPDGFMQFDLYDDDLVDTGSTTATVNTTDGSITFTTGEVFQTETLFLNNESFNTILWKLQQSVVTGSANLTYYATADGGSNWEEITPETTHTFTDSSTAGVKVKIEASDSASITLKDSTKDTPLPWFIQVT